MGEQISIISKDVKCDWCGAEPGESCRIQDDSPQGYHTSEHRGHTGRTKLVPADSPEVKR